MNTSHFSRNPDSHEPGSSQNPVQETAVEAAPAAAVPQAIASEAVRVPDTPAEALPTPAAAVPASVAPQTIPAAGACPAIEIRGLTKAFGQKVAVDRINLDIPSGSFYGLVGRNGAGKTTTISMVTGMLMPDEGTAYVRGIDMWAGPAQSQSTPGRAARWRAPLRQAHR